MYGTTYILSTSVGMYVVCIHKLPGVKLGNYYEMVTAYPAERQRSYLHLWHFFLFLEVTSHFPSFLQT